MKIFRKQKRDEITVKLEIGKCKVEMDGVTIGEAHDILLHLKRLDALKAAKSDGIGFQSIE